MNSEVRYPSMEPEIEREIPVRHKVSSGQRAAVFRRDDACCVINSLGLCDRMGCDGSHARKEVSVHHVVSQMVITEVEERLQRKIRANHPLNLATLCGHAHVEIHRIKNEVDIIIDLEALAPNFSPDIISCLGEIDTFNWYPWVDKELVAEVNRRTYEVLDTGTWRFNQFLPEEIRLRVGEQVV